MGIFRDFGAALSFGKMETTKAKDARERYEARCDGYSERLGRYKNFISTTLPKFQRLQAKAREGREAIIATGALEVDPQGKLQMGWYYAGMADINGIRDSGGTAAALAGGAGAFAAAIGAPAAAWTAVGVLGTASTGAAISGLSGAAATSATAAWFGGGAVAAGGLGMAAAPFALTGIGALAMAPVLGIGFLKSKRKEKERLDAVSEKTTEIDTAEREMNERQRHLETVIPQIAPAVDRLQTATVETKSADATRREKIEAMRTELSIECARIGELTQVIGDTIRATTGARDENATLTEQSQRLASTATELHSAAEKHEGIVNQAIDETVEKIETLAQAIHDADNIIQQADPEYGNGQK